MFDSKYDKRNRRRFKIDNITKVDKSVNKLTINEIKTEFEIYARKQNNFDFVDANNEYIEKYIVEQNCPIVVLSGEFGIRAKTRIKKGTVISRYVGKEFLEKEFDKSYKKNSLLYWQRSKYLFSSSFQDINTLQPRKKQRLSKKIQNQNKKIVN